MAAYMNNSNNDEYDYFEKPKHGTTITYQLAGLWPRLIALFIDSLILGMLGGMLFIGGRGVAGFAVSFVIGVGYHWFFLTRYNGQTPGKMIMGIRVIKANGSPLTGTDAMVRYIGYYVNSLPFLLGLGWFWAVIDRNSQGFHDKLANTYVVIA